MKPRIFISAVSDEFATLRDQRVDPLLRKLGYEPDAMKVFPTLSGDLRQALRERIDACEGLIQLVGAGYGREPPSVDSDYGRVSYTQFELYYARLKGKKLWVFTAAEGTGVQRDQLIEQLDLPPATENLEDPLAYQAERRRLQQAYRERLRADGLLRHSFDNADRLENLLNGIRDELHELYRQWAEMREQVSRIENKTDTLLAEQREMRQIVDKLFNERATAEPTAPASDARSPEALLSALEDIMQTREGQEALRQFQQGQEAAALQALDCLRATQARSVANLALTALQRGKISLRDVVARYVELVRLDPESFWDQIELARLLQLLGDLPHARQVAEQAQGLAKRRAEADPSNAQAQRHVSVSLDNVGDIQAAQGDATAALESYQLSFLIREVLALADPSNAQAQRDVSVSLNNVGNIQAAQGNVTTALKSYQRMLTIAEALAQADPSNAQARRDLSVSLEKVGNIQAAQGNATSALKNYQQSLRIRKALALADPSNAQAQRDVLVSHFKLWQLATARAEKIHHAQQIDRIFTELETRGAFISPADRGGWDRIKQWLSENAP